jgi:hypothetical protein
VSDIINADAGHGAEDDWGWTIRLFLTIVLGLVLGVLVCLGAYWLIWWEITAALGFLVIVAILMLVVSLALPGKPGVISNGLFMGAVVAMLSAMGLMGFVALVIVSAGLLLVDVVQESFVAVGLLVLAIVLTLGIFADYLRLRGKKVQAAGEMEKELARGDS